MGVCADNQGGFSRFGFDEFFGDAQRIDEAGAYRLHVEGGALGDPQPRLQTAGGGGINLVRGGGADDDEIDVFGPLVRGFQRPAGRSFRQIAGGFSVGDDVTLANSGALPDPLIRCVDRGLQLLIGQYSFRQVASGAAYSGVDHTTSLSESTDSRRSRILLGTFLRISAAASVIARVKATTSALP